MRIAIGVGGEVIGAPMTPQDIVDEVTTAEADGFGAAWSVHFSRGVDALDILAVAGTRTSGIDLGVGIVPTYPRHPLALAQQAADEIFSRYAGMDNYRRLLEREGVPSPGAVAIAGPDAEIEKQLARLAGVGVTELWPIIFPVGDAPRPAGSAPGSCSPGSRPRARADRPQATRRARMSSVVCGTTTWPP